MKPINYVKYGNDVRFIYDTDELKNWIRLGNRDGNVGTILHSRVDGFNKYVGYGTCENPVKTRFSIILKHHPLFDGKLKSPDEIISNSNKVLDDSISLELIWLDFSKKD